MRLPESKILSELFLALLGEPCVFTKTKVSGFPEYQDFIVNEDIVNTCLPMQLILMMGKITELSSYVRAVQLCKRRKKSESDDLVRTSTRNFQNQEVNSPPTDAIKKAMFESIMNDYNVYLQAADTMRIKHINENCKTGINDVVNFALMWHKRLRFVRSLLSTLEINNGISLLNILYAKHALICAKNWEHSLMEHALHQGSLTLSHICQNWLLEGHLDANTNWMVKLGKEQPATLMTSNQSDSGTTCNSFNNSLTGQIQPLLQDQRTTTAESMQQQPNELIIQVSIDKNLVPTTISTCPEITQLILDIGSKVHFLKTLRTSNIYSHKMAERKEILQNSLIPEVWYNPMHRAPFTVTLRKLNAIVCEDVLDELVQKQRLIDHLTLVHSYFFMLRGDLFAELEWSVLINFVTPTVYYQTPSSVRKSKSNTTTNETLMKLMDKALTKCAPLQNVADLMCYLTPDKIPHSRGRSAKNFFELFAIDYAFKSKTHGDEIQHPPPPLKLFFSRDLLKIYKRVFTIATNLQTLRFQLDEILHRFTHETSKLIRTESDKFLITLVNFNIYNVRIFLTRFANYLFEDVLLLESSSILCKIQRETDPHGFINKHQKLLNGMMRALFIYAEGASIFKQITQTVRNARTFVIAVEDFCAAVSKRDSQKEQTILLAQQMNNKIQPMIETLNDDRAVIRRKMVRIGSDESDKLDKCHFELRDTAEKFKQSHSQLRTLLSRFIDNETKKESGYWPKLYSLLFTN